MEASRTRSAQTLRLRIPASVFLLLSLVGAFDYIMIFTHSNAYFRYMGYGQRQVEYFTSYPAPLAILLTAAVWGSVIGAICLLFKSRWAVVSIGIAFLGQLVLGVYTFAARNRWEVLGTRLGVQDILILVLTLVLLLYAIRLLKKGVIR